MEPQEKAELLKSWALEAGFDRAGVAHLGPSEGRRALLSWLERGEHAGMEYMARRVELRLQPERILEGARSALSVALQYEPAEESEPVAGDLWPRVARYARGRDYHEVMWERLEGLSERIRAAFPGSAARYYVDTGPVLERELAARAGLGAVGKNTNLLHPEAGSWFFLGELFLTLDLAPDPPLADLCGSCTRCLEACPTGALPEAYRLDARRCISYWTIEHRGALPPVARPMLQDWVFGCDICQEVCPWNEAPRPPADPSFAPAAGRRDLDLAGLLGLRRERYQRLFRGSPMKRARLEGLRRNAAVAMGNRRRRRYVEPLGEALRDGDPVLRGHAAWALGEIGGERAVELLRTALEGERDRGARKELLRALGRVAGGAPGGGSG